MNKGFITLLLCLLVIVSPVQAESDDAAKAKASYYTIAEPFTINFLNQSEQKVRYLQIRVALMSHDAEIIKQAELNLPMIQDALRTLFTDQRYQTVSTLDGRKQLQQQALQLVKEILAKETGNNKLEAVYFTSFILQ